MCQADVPSERHNANGDSIVIMITYILEIVVLLYSPSISILGPTLHHARDPCVRDGMEHILSIL